MEYFFEVKDTKFIYERIKAGDIAFRGCHKAVSDKKLLFHWVLTTAESVDFDMFDSFSKLIKLLVKAGVVFEFFVVEARNEREGCHLHVLVSSSVFVDRRHLQNLWVRVHCSYIVRVIPVCESESERLDEAILRITKYVTFGNHRESMLRYGYSSGWIGGVYRGE